jgi:hypothetical protein
MVTDISACRSTCMITRGCASRSTSRVAHVRRASWTVIFLTPARRHRRHRRSHARLKVRGSTGVPYLPVKRKVESCHCDPAVRRSAVLFSARRNATRGGSLSHPDSESADRAKPGRLPASATSCLVPADA